MRRGLVPVPGPVAFEELAADDTWVEVLRWTCGAVARTVGEGNGYGCWFTPFMAGSGLWVNVGRSLRVRTCDEVETLLEAPDTCNHDWSRSRVHMGRPRAKASVEPPGPARGRSDEAAT